MFEKRDLVRKQKEKKNNLDLIDLVLRYQLIPEDKAQEIISAINKDLVSFQEAQIKIFTLLKERGVALEKIKNDSSISKEDRFDILKKEELIKRIFTKVASGKVFLSE